MSNQKSKPEQRKLEAQDSRKMQEPERDWNTGAVMPMGRERQKDLLQITCAMIAGGTRDSVEQTVLFAEKYLAEIEKRCKE